MAVWENPETEVVKSWHFMIVLMVLRKSLKSKKLGKSLKLWCFFGKSGILEIFYLQFQLVVSEILYGFEISRGA